MSNDINIFFCQKKKWFRSDAETVFEQGRQNQERQIDGICIEFGPRFCPRNKRSLKKRKKVFSGFGPRSCLRSKCSLKKGLCRLPTVFVWLRIQFSGGAQVAQEELKYFQGAAVPLPPYFPRLCDSGTNNQHNKINAFHK